MKHTSSFYAYGDYETQLVLKQELVNLNQALRQANEEKERVVFYLETVSKYLNIKKEKIFIGESQWQSNYLQPIKNKLKTINYNIYFIENGLTQLKIYHNQSVYAIFKKEIGNKIFEAKEKLDGWRQWREIYHNKLIWLNTPIEILQQLHTEKVRDLENINENLKHLEGLIHQLEEELAGLRQKLK